MDQQQLKTSWQVRIVVGIIAFLMLFSTVAVYALIVLTKENDKKENTQVAEELAKVEEELTEKRKAVEELVSKLSDKYFDELKSYRSYVKSYNAQAVNNGSLKTKDLKVGKGKEITSDSSYYSYYIGWCSDETIFDSSFNDSDKPTALIDPISYTAGESNFIAGWEEGVLGMKVGGVRQLEIPSTLAYGDSQSVCNTANSPLKYIVMVVDPGEDYDAKLAAYNEVYQQYLVLYYSQNGTLNTVQ